MIRYRMGGPQAWKEMQEKQQEFQNEFNAGFAQGGPGEIDGYDGRSDTDTRADIELETQNEREARGGDDAPEDLNDNVSFNGSDSEVKNVSNGLILGVYDVDDAEIAEYRARGDRLQQGISNVDRLATSNMGIGSSL